MNNSVETKKAEVRKNIENVFDQPQIRLRDSFQFALNGW